MKKELVVWVTNKLIELQEDEIQNWKDISLIDEYYARGMKEGLITALTFIGSIDEAESQE